jgi:GTP-binding protein EngB required for normal cell division
MNLAEYERAKFELAELLRSIAALVKDPSREHQERLRELFARLAEDRFNLVVVGRFSRGKTSLMNAILGTGRLPVGIVPLTSVITTVTYGSKEQVVIHYHDHGLTSEVPLEALPEYVTQQRNPGNVRRVKTAEVKLPAEILRRGFYFIDTPGLGSPIPENTLTTESFLPEADAMLLVTSYESPLSEEERRVLQAAAASARRAYVVLNKHDTVSSGERAEVLNYAREQLSAWFDQNTPPVFSVSALDGLAAKRSGDTARLAASGLPELETELVRFLLTEKSGEFLLRLCDRIEDWLRELSGVADTAPLVEQIRALSCRIARDRPGAARRGETPTETPGASDSLRKFQPCEVCARMLDATFEFLRRYQYDLSISPQVQRNHAERGGLCALHTWQYALLAAPRDICTGYPALLDRLSAWFHDAASAALAPDSLAAEMRGLIPTNATCDLCRVCAQTEAGAIASIAGRLKQEPDNGLNTLSAVCLPHLRGLIAAVGDTGLAGKLMAREALVLERLSEDMRRYATKHDAVRRFLASEEERNSSQRALLALAGLRNVNMARGND